MEKFVLSTRRSLAIVSYIAASMGYSKEEIKFITAGMLKQNGEVNEFHKILTEPLDKIVRVEHKGEVKDLVEPFNLVERIQMVIELIINKSTVTESINLKPTASVYQYSPFKFSNFIKKPEDKPKLVHEEEYLCDEALIKKFGEKRLEAIIKERVEEELQKRENLEKERLDEKHRKEMFEETMARINGDARFSSQANVYNRPFYSRPFPHQQPRPDFTPGFNPSTGEYATSEIEELNQAIETLVRLRDKLILDNNEKNLNERNKESQEPKEQPEPFEPVKFTEEQRQRQREILGDPDGATSRYNAAADRYMEKSRKEAEERKKEREMEIQNQSKDSEDTEETIEVRFYNSTEEANLVKESIKIERTSRSSTWCDGMHIAAGSFNGHVVEIFPKEILHKLSEDLSKRTPNELFSFICGDADNLYIDNDQLAFPKLSFSANGLSPKSIAVVTTTRGDNGKGLISVKVDVDRLIKLIDISKEDITDTLKAVSNKHQIDLSKGSIVVNGTLLNSTYIRVMRKLQDERVKEVLKLIEKAVKNIFNNRKLTNWLLAGADF